MGGDALKNGARLALIVATATAMALLAACRKPAPQATAPDVPETVRVYSQYSQGDTLELVQTQLALDNCEVRYRSGMPDGQMGMIYFMREGNLHIDAEKIGSTWVLLNSPMLELSSTSAEERVAEWDRAADPQRIITRSDQ